MDDGNGESILGSFRTGIEWLTANRGELFDYVRYDGENIDVRMATGRQFMAGSVGGRPCIGYRFMSPPDKTLHDYRMVGIFNLDENPEWDIIEADRPLGGEAFLIHWMPKVQFTPQSVQEFLSESLAQLEKMVAAFGEYGMSPRLAGCDLRVLTVKRRSYSSRKLLDLLRSSLVRTVRNREGFRVSDKDGCLRVVCGEDSFAVSLKDGFLTTTFLLETENPLSFRDRSKIIQALDKELGNSSYKRVSGEEHIFVSSMNIMDDEPENDLEIARQIMGTYDNVLQTVHRAGGRATALEWNPRFRNSFEKMSAVYALLTTMNYTCPRGLDGVDDSMSELVLEIHGTSCSVSCFMGHIFMMIQTIVDDGVDRRSINRMIKEDANTVFDWTMVEDLGMAYLVATRSCSQIHNRSDARNFLYDLAEDIDMLNNSAPFEDGILTPEVMAVSMPSDWFASLLESLDTPVEVYHYIRELLNGDQIESYRQPCTCRGGLMFAFCGTQSAMLTMRGPYVSLEFDYEIRDPQKASPYTDVTKCHMDTEHWNVVSSDGFKKTATLVYVFDDRTYGQGEIVSILEAVVKDVRVFNSRKGRLYRFEKYQ